LNFGFSRLRAPLLAMIVIAVSAPAEAQTMNIALSRLSADPMVSPRTGDDDAYRRVMTQFAGSMLPPVLTPAGTRGVRGIYVGFESWITGIDNHCDPGNLNSSGCAWHRAVEGDGVGDTTRSRFVDPVLAWGRLNVRKGLPFGLELGTSIGYLYNTSYWSLGAEIRWAIFEGFRDDAGWIPDVAVRGAVQTLIGDGEFNVTVPSVDVTISEPFVVGNAVEISPWVSGQVAFPFVDSELVDLTPATSSFTGCNPDPSTPTDMSGSPPYCRGDGSDLNNNYVFPSLRSMRWRLGIGTQIRYEWFTLLGSFMFDLVKPGDTYGDPSLPSDLDRQWTVNLGIGLTL
jgi:hypothetical protein